MSTKRFNKMWPITLITSAYSQYNLVPGFSYLLVLLLIESSGVDLPIYFYFVYSIVEVIITIKEGKAVNPWVPNQADGNRMPPWIVHYWKWSKVVFKYFFFQNLRWAIVAPCLNE